MTTRWELPSPRLVPDPPRLDGRHVVLVPITPGDYEYLYRISVLGENLFTWRLRGVLPSPENFIQQLWLGVFTQLKIVSVSTGEPAGLVLAYNADFRNQLVHFAMLTDPRAQGSGWSFEASTIFITYLFEAFPFRKIYLESYEFNYQRFSSGAGTVFNVEGCLRDYEFYQGRFWHKYILAIPRDGWDQVADKFGVASDVKFRTNER
jgi:RimJ/RimL family protein N-acetyltransferase